MIDEKKLIERLNDKESFRFSFKIPKDHFETVQRICRMYHEKVCKIIENQLKVGEWIPCSEQMPEVPKGIEYDECPEFNVTIKGAKEATTLRCYSEGTWFDDNGYVYPVIAWQPLPEAYHEELSRGCKNNGKDKN